MLFNKESHFNIANLVTYTNITMGALAIFFVLEGNFFVAIILAWIGGACDIIDGKLARKYNLSGDFGIQVDSFADLLSFAIMPTFLLFYAIKTYSPMPPIEEITLGIVFLWYLISAVRRLAVFNSNASTSTPNDYKYFEGVPTPLGAILLWVMYLLNAYDVINSGYINAILVYAIALSLNSKLKIPHP